MLRIAGWALAALVALFALASLDWRPARPARPAEVVRAARSPVCPLAAGAAKVTMMPGWPVSLGGFRAAASRTTSAALDTLSARALVLEACQVRLALVSLEVIYVPEALADAIAARLSGLGLSGLVVAATHTHAGPGGLDQNPVAQLIGAGRHDARTFDLVADRAVAAAQTAFAGRAPAALGFHPLEAEGLSRPRGDAGSDEPLPRSWVVRVDGAGGPVAALVIHGAHATVLGSGNGKLSGDWPGAMMASLERSPGGVALFFQGAEGDRTHTAPPLEDRAAAARAFGERVAERARAALLVAAPAPSAALGFAGVRLALPRAEAGAVPWLLRGVARNALALIAPESAPAAALDLGGLTLLAAPAEPVAEVALGFEARAGGTAATVALAGGYLGYVEGPSSMRAGTGEAKRTWFGPELAERLGEALAAAARAAR